MKHTITILAILLVVPLVFFACTNDVPNGQSNASDASASGQTTNDMPNAQASKDLDDDNPINMEELFNDIGKTLNTLKNEHSGGEIFTCNDGLPDAAAICFGEPEGKYSYYFFGTQDGDFKKVTDGYGDQLKCAGLLTTAEILFPEMEGDMPFSDFFSLIDVSEYEYFVGEDTITAEGWLNFKCNHMNVWLNTNESNTRGGWKFTADERVKSSAPVAIIDEEIDDQNYALAVAIMFE